MAPLKQASQGRLASAYSRWLKRTVFGAFLFWLVFDELSTPPSSSRPRPRAPTTTTLECRGIVNGNLNNARFYGIVWSSLKFLKFTPTLTEPTFFGMGTYLRRIDFALRKNRHVKTNEKGNERPKWELRIR